MQPDHRDAFHVPGEGAYLLTHSIGCLSRRTKSVAIQKLLRLWRELGGDAWSEWLTAIDRFGDSLAVLGGGRSSEYCPQPNVSSALTKLIAALPLRNQTKRVWIAAEDSFPSLGYVLQKAQRLGFRLIPRTRRRSAVTESVRLCADHVVFQTCEVRLEVLRKKVVDRSLGRSRYTAHEAKGFVEVD